uniref:Secreted protein n=2 Tax=Caenorhabditis tropicalis TaxID=1561998 RepID=A0A1I7U9V7_9PELO
MVQQMVSPIDARTMRFAIIAVLLMVCMVYAANDTELETAAAKKQAEKDEEDLKKHLRIIRSHNFVVMDISALSKTEFAEYMSGFCLATDQMTEVDYIDNYIDWEEIEFLDSVKNFLGVIESDPNNTYFSHLGHYTVSNCSLINEKQKRDVHHHVAQAALFDNYMYDQMTRNEWTRLYL